MSAISELGLAVVVLAGAQVLLAIQLRRVQNWLARVEAGCK